MFLKGGENVKKNRKKRFIGKIRVEFIIIISVLSWFLFIDVIDILIVLGYICLSDNLEVKMVVYKIVDLVLSMIIYFMQNIDNGDIRVKNELFRKIDINLYFLMIGKIWVYNIVFIMFLAGNGNCVVYLFVKDGLIDELIFLKVSGVSFMEIFIGYNVFYNGQIYRYDEVLYFVINLDFNYLWKGIGYRVVLKDIVNNFK